MLDPRTAEELGTLAFTDLLEDICTETVRRHPHVLKDLDLKDRAAVRAKWARETAAEHDHKGPSEGTGA